MADRNKEISEACDNSGNLNKFRKRELQLYLASYLQNVSGCKADLIERVRGTHRLNLPDQLTLDKVNNDIQINTITRRFTTPQGEIIPKPETIDSWTDNLTLHFPEFTDRDIYNYIVLKKNAKKQLKSKVFYEDGHVHNIQVNLLDENTSHMYVRASVIPSFPTADKKKSPDYSPWILMSKVTGCVHSAACNCPAGDGECCNHIGALLYAVRDISEKNREGRLSSTSQKCKWNVPSTAPRKRKLTPKKSQELVFKKSKFESSLRKPVSGLNLNSSEQKSSVNVERFREKLIAEGLNVGWLKNFKTDKIPEPELPKLHNIDFCYSDRKNLSNFDCVSVFRKYMTNLLITEDECQIIETLTRGQSNLHWTEARKERLTASYFGQVCKRKLDTKPENLLKSILYTSFSNSFTEYGKKHEKAARKMYMKSLRCTHEGLLVRETGLIVNPKKPFLGASPDGLIYCPHCAEDPYGVLEIKCPASLKWRMSQPEECALDKDFFCEIVNGAMKLKRNHNYYFQVQGQMAITGRKWCDFVVWTCVGFCVERILYDKKLWEEMSGKLDTFYRECFIPELFSRRVERNMQLYTY